MILPHAPSQSESLPTLMKANTLLAPSFTRSANPNESIVLLLNTDGIANILCPAMFTRMVTKSSPKRPTVNARFLPDHF